MAAPIRWLALASAAAMVRPSLCMPGDHPEEEINTQCLLYQGNGCHAIKDENTCLSSRDGRFFEYLQGRDVRSQPCVWCGGRPCESGGDNLCESYSWAIGNPSHEAPRNWVAANCLDGRDIQESLARATNRSLPSVQVAFSDFDPVGGAVGRACRGGTGDAAGDEFGHWSYSMWTASSLQECMSLCAGNCTGVEYKHADRYCEVWWDLIQASAPADGFSCHKRKKVKNWQPLALALPPGAGELTAATPLDIDKVSVEAEPAAAAPADHGTNASAEPGRPAPTTVPCAPVVGHTAADVGEWPAPLVARGAGQPGGRFVKAGLEGEVFWQDALGKHPLPAGVRCSQCGCDGENVEVLPAAEVFAMPLAETFHCIATAPAAGDTPIPLGGRFLVVDEELAAIDTNSGLGVDLPHKVHMKLLFWQNVTRVVHPLPPGFNCTCGCAAPLRIAKAEVDDLPRGSNFTCAMVTGVPDRELLVPWQAATEETRSSRYKWAIAGMTLFVGGAVFAFCARPLRSKSSTRRAKRGLTLEDNDAEVAGVPPAREAAAPAMLGWVPSALKTVWVAPPRYTHVMAMPYCGFGSAAPSSGYQTPVAHRGLSPCSPLRSARRGSSPCSPLRSPVMHTPWRMTGSSGSPFYLPSGLNTTSSAWGLPLALPSGLNTARSATADVYIPPMEPTVVPTEPTVVPTEPVQTPPPPPPVLPMDPRWRE